MQVIDLDNHRDAGVKVLSGRSRGKIVRQAVHLDDIDYSDEEVKIVVPDDVFLVASSFLLGMLGPSIREHGEDEFRSRFYFDGPINESIINDVIDEALKRERPLA